jgi:hypothetical protein
MSHSIREKLNLVSNTIVDKFNEHPKQNGQSYQKHFMNSMYFGLCSMVCALIFFLHAIFPFLFEKTGGNVVKHLQNYTEHSHCSSRNNSEESEESESSIEEESEEESEESEEQFDKKE